MAARVLVVEDNAADLELVVGLLEQAGCQALTAKTAEGGFLLAIEEHPDLILMDLRLPGMTGYEAIRQLKGNPATAGIPIVAITASAMRGDEDRARGAGADVYLTKPLDARAFREILRSSLRPRATGD
jgi:two-component system cell cycle response regulator DivK